MVYSRIFLQILLRVLILTALLAGMVYSYFQTKYVVTPIMFGLFIMMAIGEMIHFLRKSERGWSQFLLTVKHQDFNTNYDFKSDSRQLREAYQLISTSFETLRVSRQAEHRLLNTVLSHVPIAVACVHDSGEVMFANKAFKIILALEAIVHVDTLSARHAKLHQMLTNDPIGDPVLLELNNGHRVLAKTESFALQGEKYKLISMTDVKSTLDTQELENYQKLMRVMTHEIMNSATPILSLIKVVNQKLITGDRFNQLASKDQGNIATSLSAIEVRTEGMLKFVKAYRKINKEFEPQRSIIDSNKFLDQITTLVKQGNAVPLDVQDLAMCDIHIDVELMSQVLINLLKNAFEAVDGLSEPLVRIILQTDESDLKIIIEDNGPGISEENIHSVFVPFFTTKPEGSGIGLSLSKKIIRSHGGNITHHRVEQQKTRFTIDLYDTVVN